jgi:hypothetical protein
VKPGLGLVVVSTRFDSPCGIGSTLLFENQANHSILGVLVKNVFAKYNMPDHDGYLWARVFGPGHWRISMIKVGDKLARFEGDPGWAFDIKPGQAVYIGEVTVHVNADCSRAAVTVQDRWSRDSVLLPTLFPGIPATEVQTQLMHRER